MMVAILSTTGETDRVLIATRELKVLFLLSPGGPSHPWRTLYTYLCVLNVSDDLFNSLKGENSAQIVEMIFDSCINPSFHFCAP